MFEIEVFFNIFMVTLLLLTIAFCWRLNSKLIELKGSKKDLADAVSKLEAALLSAHSGIQNLQQLSNNTSVAMKIMIDKGELIAEDLKFLEKSGYELANDLEGSLRYAEISLAQMDDYFTAFEAAEKRKKKPIRAAVSKSKSRASGGASVAAFEGGDEDDISDGMPKRKRGAASVASNRAVDSKNSRAASGMIATKDIEVDDEAVHDKWQMRRGAEGLERRHAVNLRRNMKENENIDGKRELSADEVASIRADISEALNIGEKKDK